MAPPTNCALTSPRVRIDGPPTRPYAFALLKLSPRGSGLTSIAAAKIGRLGVWRTALTWAVLIAFALQSYVTQTHVHWGTIAPAASSARSAIDGSQPSSPEELACPLCQAVAAAGAFVGAAPIALSLPAIRAEIAAPPPIVIVLAVRTAGFSWQSRAPPQV